MFFFMDGVRSWVSVLFYGWWSNPGLVFFLWMVSNPGLVFFLWMVSQSWVSVLFMDGVQSWSRHQKIARGLDWYNLLTMILKSIHRYSSTWCHKGDPCHGTKKLQEDWLGTKDEIGSSNVLLE